MRFMCVALTVLPFGQTGGLFVAALSVMFPVVGNVLGVVFGRCMVLTPFGNTCPRNGCI